MKNDGWSNNRLLVDYFCVSDNWLGLTCAWVHNYYCSRTRSRLPSFEWGIIIFQKMTSSSSFLNLLVSYILWVYFVADKSIDRLGTQQRLLHLTCWPAAAYRWNGEEEKSTTIQISVCRAFRGGHFAGGLFSCRVWVICTDTRVSIPSFWRLLLLLSHSREYRI